MKGIIISIYGDIMLEYNSVQELYNALIPAFNVKLRMFKNSQFSNIKRQDIWNYLKVNKWMSSINLTISEMVSDIINVDGYKIIKYKEKVGE